MYFLNFKLKNRIKLMIYSASIIVFSVLRISKYETKDKQLQASVTPAFTLKVRIFLDGYLIQWKV